MSSSPARSDVVALGTPDPVAVAQLSCDLLGWRVERTDDDGVTIRGDDGSGPGAEEDLWVRLDPAGHPFCLCPAG